MIFVAFRPNTPDFVTVYFPHALARHRRTKRDSRQWGSGLVKILIVDGETFLAELVKLALEADGHACFAVSGLEAASELLRSVRIDLVSLDLAVGGRDPLVWLEDATLSHPWLHGRVVLLTDRVLEHDEAARLLACGAQVIPKPFTLHQMREAVRAINPAGRAPSPPSPGRSELEA